MIFVETKLTGVFVVQPERLHDERGFFARTWCPQEFAGRGLNPRLEQCSVSFNRLAGTLRGLHYQDHPWQEAKLVRCTRGAIFDVALDLRPDSPTFLQHVSKLLDANNRSMLYIPEGCAHGFQSLTDDSEVCYQISAPYAPEAARGARWNDPAFAIGWPMEPTVMNERDRQFSDFQLPQPVSVRASRTLF